MGEQQQNSRATAHTVDVTEVPNPTDAQGGMTSDGEGFDVGTRYSAVLNERKLKLGGRNAGPDGRPSANTGRIPAVNANIRKTGRI